MLNDERVKEAVQVAFKHVMHFAIQQKDSLEMTKTLSESYSLLMLDELDRRNVILIRDEMLSKAFNPSHYTKGDIQPKDLMSSLDIWFDFCRANIIKYASRCKSKDQLDSDLRKIIVYAVFAIQELEKKNKANK